MPNWLSWTAYSRLPLPSLRTYAMMSLGVFLGAVLNCTTFSSGKSSYSHDFIFFPYPHSDKDEKEATGTSPFSTVKWSSISSYFKLTDDESNSHSAMKVEKALMSTLWNLVFPVSPDTKNGGQVLGESNSGAGSKPFDTLSQWSEKYTGGFPKSWNQMPYYIAFLFQHSLFVWSLINLSYCVLLMISRRIQKFVFGELRVVERQNLRDSFWNYMFYKFIFLFGVLNVQQLGELVLWTFWFSSFSFLRLMNQLSRDRYEYIAYSPNRSSNLQRKIFALLVSIFICNVSLFAFATSVHTVTSDLNVFGFMLSECIQLLLRNVLVVLKLAFHIRDVSYLETWENKALYVYYADFIVEMTALTFDLIHHAHMLIWSNVFLSMACLVVCMQVRALLLEMQRRMSRHREFCLVTKHMDAMFPEVRYPNNNKDSSSSSKAVAEETTTPVEGEGSDQKADVDGMGRKAADDDDPNNNSSTRESLRKDNGESPCAICWDVIVVGRKLPCSHIFHRSCLRSWLVQDSTCPTCRHALKLSPNTNSNSSNVPGTQSVATGLQLPIQNPNQVPGLVPGLSSLPLTGSPLPDPEIRRGPNPDNGQPTRRNYFHFDGSRIASWLPSFSVELTHGSAVASPSNSENNNNFASTPTDQVSRSQRDHWVHQIHILLPQIPLNAIRESLAITNSLELTIDQILDGSHQFLETSNTQAPSDEPMGSDDLENLTSDKRSSSKVDSHRGHFDTNVHLFDPSSVTEASVTVEPLRERSQVSVSGTGIEMMAALAEATPMEWDLSNVPKSSSQNMAGPSSSFSEITDSELTSLRQRKRESNREKEASSNGHQLEDTGANEASTSGVVFGERFSKSPKERELILQQRKEIMVQRCRRAYLMKHPDVKGNPER